MQTLFEIITTKDKSHSLKSNIFNETYHSVNGAYSESKYIFIENGVEKLKNLSEINIFEVGFGTGLNALLSFEWAVNNKKTVNYTGIEKFPVNTETINKLNYNNLSDTAENFFKKIHKAKWNEKVQLDKYFSFCKIEGDLLSFSTDKKFDLIFFDAFSPDTQNDMWSVDIFNKMYIILSNNGLLTTYSSKGTVKRNLRSAGFDVKRLPGPLGKRHMLNATKITS